MKPLSELITIHPDYVSGNVLFRGTRVPVKILFEYLKKSEAIDEFIDAHPSVERNQVINLLELIEYFLTFRKEPTYDEAKNLARL